MNGSSSLRAAWRASLFAVSLPYLAWRYWRDVARAPQDSLRFARARWLKAACRRQLRWQNVQVRLEGTLPSDGLIVANHLTYLDILALSATLPCVFVSKKEIAGWPIFGQFAKFSGTLFLDRERRGAVGGMGAQMRDLLAAGIPLVLFPEGTSTNGDQVLPFRTPLFEPVADLGYPVTAAALLYATDEGSVRDEVHWSGTQPLGPHLFNILGKRRIDVTIRFGAARPRQGDRKTIARDLYHEVVSLLPAL